MKCAQCNASIVPQNAWQVGPNCFYCSEFCAEAKECDVIAKPSYRKAQIDRQYIERLERFLPYFRQSRAASAVSRQ
jgi:hypothetical protein